MKCERCCDTKIDMLNAGNVPCPKCTGNQPESHKEKTLRVLDKLIEKTNNPDQPEESQEIDTFAGDDPHKPTLCIGNRQPDDCDDMPQYPEESREKQLQPVKNDDERIREAFEAEGFKPWPRVFPIDYFKAGFKSRDEEVERLDKLIKEYSNSRRKIRIELREVKAKYNQANIENSSMLVAIGNLEEEITALRAQIEEMKCCAEEVIEEYPDCYASAMKHLQVKWAKLEKEK